MGGGRRPLGAKEGEADQQGVDGCSTWSCSHGSLSIGKEKVGFADKFYKIQLQGTQVIYAAQNRKVM